MSIAILRRPGTPSHSDKRALFGDEPFPAVSPPFDLIRPSAKKQVPLFSAAEQARLVAEDSLAWRTVCLELVAIVAGGALAMALIVAAVSL